MGKFTAYKLPLKSLAKGSHEFDYTLGKQFFVDMESADVRDADVKVKLTVTYNGDVYDLNFVFTGEVTVLCDRCLDDLHLPIETAYHILVKYGDTYNDDSDDLLEIPDSDNYLNVAYMLYDTVALAIPIKHVHPLGKCNRAMSAILKKHRARATGEDADLENDLIDEMDQMDDDGGSGQGSSDPRWDALRGMSSAGGDE
ncbi:MAG: DUF177 domain-containing protein [Muribaculaceae bacterium]|nr:DUF177 domain-containing protein [Muribaculaceae bacterium]